MTTSYIIDTTIDESQQQQRHNEVTRILIKESMVDYYLARHELGKLHAAALKCQKWRRMKQFRKAVQLLKIEATKRAIEMHAAASRELAIKFKLAEDARQAKLVECAVRCQRSFRMKLFRRNLQILKVNYVF